MSPRLASAFLAAAFMTVPLALPAQQRTPRFETTTSVMRIQVRVVDEQGSFVSGLAASDFRLLIDGTSRRLIDVIEMGRGAGRSATVVAAAEAVSSNRAGVPVAAAAPGADSATGVLGAAQPETDLPGAAQRHFLIFVDLNRANLRTIRYVREAAIDFIDEVIGPDDRVGLALYGGWGGLDLRVPFTTDHLWVREALQGIGTREAAEAVGAESDAVPFEELVELEEAIGVEVEGIDWLREVQATQVAMRAEGLMQGLRDLSEELAVVEGRKHVLFLSAGLPNSVLENAGFRAEAMRATEAARLADVVLHSFQPDRLPVSDYHDISQIEMGRRGRDPMSGLTDRTPFPNRDVLHLLADETGGSTSFYRHNLRKGMRRLERNTRGYYVLAFPISPNDGATVDIEVRFERSNLVVADAPARLDLPDPGAPLSAMQLKLEIAEAVDLSTGRSDVVMDLLAVPLRPEGGIGRLVLITEVPASELLRLRDDNGGRPLEFQLLGLALDGARNVRDSFRSTVRVSELDESGGVVTPLRYYNELRLPPGRYFVRLLVLETSNGRLASRSMRLDVPEVPAAGLGLTGPLRLLSGGRMFRGQRSDRSAPGHTGGSLPYPFTVADLELMPAVTSRLPAGAEVELYAVVHGLTSHPLTGQRVASATLHLERAEQSPLVLQTTLDAVDEDASGGRRIMVRARLPTTLEAGPRQLVLQIVDGVSGETVQGAVELTITGARNPPGS